MLPVDHIKPLCRPWGLRMPPEDVGAFRCLLIHALCMCKGFPGICHASHRNEAPLRVTHNYGYRLCSGTLPQAQAFSLMLSKSLPLPELHSQVCSKTFHHAFIIFLASLNLPICYIESHQESEGEGNSKVLQKARSRTGIDKTVLRTHNFWHGT